jgi:hypothetical protein
MIKKFRYYKMDGIGNDGSHSGASDKPSVKGAFSFAGDLPDINSGQPDNKKMGRGSQSFAWAGASSSYSSYCKYRKEVMRQR